MTKQLNQQAMSGELPALAIIATPQTLGELRNPYHKTLSAALAGEIPKDLTGQFLVEIEKAITAA